MAKQAKFFCDFCGAQVKQNDKICKHCGKFFSSVKCPYCNKVGDAKTFANGCPHCGYASAPAYTEVLQKKEITSDRQEDPLPVWIYAVCLCVLGAVLFFLYGYLKGNL